MSGPAQPGRCRICDSSPYGCSAHPRDPSQWRWDRALRRCVPADPVICSGCGQPCDDCNDGCPEHLSALLSRDAAR